MSNNPLTIAITSITAVFGALSAADCRLKYNLNKMEVKITENIKNLCVMSYNIRCFSISDTGKKCWLRRAGLVRRNIEKEQPAVVGFQEVTKLQYPYLKNILDSYDSTITFRDNTPSTEGCPIFYRKDLYRLKKSGSFWLSKTPEKMSRDWGAACYRICSYVILTSIAAEKDFVVFNTHLDHVSSEARIKGIDLVLKKIMEFGSLPAVLMGDFNASEDSETYIRATENFLDCKYQTKNTMTSCTYQNWGEDLEYPCIDYIMLSKTGFTVERYAVLRDTYDGVYPSDHFPVVAELEFN